MSSTYFELIERLNSSRHKNCDYFFMPFAEPHIDIIEISQPDVAIAKEFINVKECIVYQSQIGPAITAFVKGKPVVVFGLIPIWTGVAQAWMIADDAARRKPIAMTKVAKHFFDISEISQRLHRTQITVKTSDKRAEKWALHLGFGIEGVMRKYGPDQSDHYIMARYNNGGDV